MPISLPPADAFAGAFPGGGDWLPLSCLRGARFRGWAFPVARCGSVLILLSADNVLLSADDRGLSAGIRL